MPESVWMDDNLHSPSRELIELRMAHADLDQLIDAAGPGNGVDELSLRRMKKRRLQLRDRIALLERWVSPPESA